MGSTGWTLERLSWRFLIGGIFRGRHRPDTCKVELGIFDGFFLTGVGQMFERLNLDTNLFST